MALYDQLLALHADAGGGAQPGGRGGRGRRPGRGLALVDGLDLPRHQLFHAVRADLLRRLGRAAEAAAAYDAAIALTGNEPERAFLARRLASLG